MCIYYISYRGDRDRETEKERERDRERKRERGRQRDREIHKERNKALSYINQKIMLVNPTYRYLFLVGSFFHKYRPQIWRSRDHYFQYEFSFF